MPACPTCAGTGRVFWTSTGPGDEDGYWTPASLPNSANRSWAFEQCPNPLCDEGEVP